MVHKNRQSLVRYCLFQIVGRQFDTVVEEEMSRYFETIYALLDTVSPQYRQSFGEALAERLTQLQNQSQDGD